jgi:hypothetical protein
MANALAAQERPELVGRRPVGAVHEVRVRLEQQVAAVRVGEPSCHGPDVHPGGQLHDCGRMPEAMEGEVETGLMVGGPEDEAHTRAYEEMARLVASADLPRLREAMPHFMNRDLEAQFEFGLDLLIEGIRARIAVSS